MNTTLTPDARFVSLPFRRPEAGPIWIGQDGTGIPFCGLPGWQSNGGDYRGHPARGLPFSLEIPLEEIEGALKRIEIFGVFALYADGEREAPGTFGATLQILDEREVAFRLDLINGRHYGDCDLSKPVNRSNGDGSSIQTVGSARVGDVEYRVDRLTVDLPTLAEPRSLLFKDLGSAASFILFDVVIDVERPAGCPFHSKSGLIPLGEVASIVRVGDRRRFQRALDQLTAGILASQDLDEGRGQALTFLAVVTTGMLESGGTRELHRIQLEAARRFDQLQTKEDVAEEARELCERTAESLFICQDSPSAHLVDRALAIVERNFAKDLTDAIVADQLGLSTSHFRFLFKQATGNPFHKYLVAVRLEKAKQMLMENEMPVSQVAAAVGFTGLSHFSRAFTQRFSASPTSIRRTSG
ncbi:MAG: helix-turn-helix transcriptional regulator [Armatimonadetes bacterium]|nr:helix-turn-helix transcriptional regulator [Armatimonadota bacterium]